MLSECESTEPEPVLCTVPSGSGCWFLAVGFEKAEWKKDVVAFRDACTHAGLSVSVERSRSDNATRGSSSMHR